MICIKYKTKSFNLKTNVKIYNGTNFRGKRGLPSDVFSFVFFFVNIHYFN